MNLHCELSRRKLRTTLTIVGITDGIWALVVFSFMANKINGLVGMGTEFYADKIVVTAGEAFGTSPMRLADADAIAGLDGVAAVDPRIQFLWDPDPAVGFGVPDLLTGLIPGADAGHETIKLELATGRIRSAQIMRGARIQNRTCVLARPTGVERADAMNSGSRSREPAMWSMPTGVPDPDNSASSS